MRCRNLPRACWLRPSRGQQDAERRRPARRVALRLLSGLLLPTLLVGSSDAQADAVLQSAPSDPYAAHIAEASQRFAIPAAWIRAVIARESAGDARAVSSAGAQGLMQIMPPTWGELRVRWLLGQDPFDPRDNILAGTAYLSEMHDRFGSPGFLAAYNAGPARYEAYLAGRPLPAETLAYVTKLSPLIGAGTLPGPVSMASDPILAMSWRHSPLFHAAAVARAEPSPPEPGNTATAQRSVAPDALAITPHSDGLFAGRTGMAGPL